MKSWITNTMKKWWGCWWVPKEEVPLRLCWNQAIEKQRQWEWVVASIWILWIGFLGALWMTNPKKDTLLLMSSGVYALILGMYGIGLFLTGWCTLSRISLKIVHDHSIIEDVKWDRNDEQEFKTFNIFSAFGEGLITSGIIAWCLSVWYGFQGGIFEAAIWFTLGVSALQCFRVSTICWRKNENVKGVEDSLMERYRMLMINKWDSKSKEWGSEFEQTWKEQQELKKAISNTDKKSSRSIKRL